MPHPNHGCILVSPAGRRIAEAFQYAQVACTAVLYGALFEAAGTAACNCVWRPNVTGQPSWGGLMSCI